MTTFFIPLATEFGISVSRVFLNSAKLIPKSATPSAKVAFPVLHFSLNALVIGLLLKDFSSASEITVLVLPTCNLPRIFFFLVVF